MTDAYGKPFAVSHGREGRRSRPSGARETSTWSEFDRGGRSRCRICSRSERVRASACGVRVDLKFRRARCSLGVLRSDAHGHRVHQRRRGRSGRRARAGERCRCGNRERCGRERPRERPRAARTDLRAAAAQLSRERFCGTSRQGARRGVPRARCCARCPGVEGFALRLPSLQACCSSGSTASATSTRARVCRIPTASSAGRNLMVNAGAFIYGRGGLSFGDYVMIGPNAVIVSSQHRFDDPRVPMVFLGHRDGPGEHRERRVDRRQRGDPARRQASPTAPWSAPERSSPRTPSRTRSSAASRRARSACGRADLEVVLRSGPL